MTFDPEGWEEAAVEIGADLPSQPTALPREVRREMASRLLDAGWSYRAISAATDIPVGTLHRWLSGASPSVKRGSRHSWIWGVLIGAGLVLAVASGAIRAAHIPKTGGIGDR